MTLLRLLYRHRAAIVILLAAALLVAAWLWLFWQISMPVDVDRLVLG